MLIIADKRLPGTAKQNLKSFFRRQETEDGGQIVIPEEFNFLELETDGIVYPAISGHPDIFFCPTPSGLVVSPGLPPNYRVILSNAGVGFITGHLASGIRHPASIHYNAAVNNHYLVHRLEYTDPVILENCHFLKKINVNQGYTRCNMIWLKHDRYITSDPGIHRTLYQNGLEGLYVSPEGILLPGFRNGFIGGTMCVYQNSVVFTGSLSQYPEGVRLGNYLVSMNYNIIELYDGPLVDSGGVIIHPPFF